MKMKLVLFTMVLIFPFINFANPVSVVNTAASKVASNRPNGWCTDTMQDCHDLNFQFSTTTTGQWVKVTQVPSPSNIVNGGNFSGVLCVTPGGSLTLPLSWISGTGTVKWIIQQCNDQNCISPALTQVDSFTLSGTPGNYIATPATFNMTLNGNYGTPCTPMPISFRLKPQA